MILGIDHIAISTSCVHESARELENEGAEIVFIENDIPNGDPKRDYLSAYTPRHSIALCRPRDGIAVEFTQHETSTGLPGSYRLIGNIQSTLHDLVNQQPHHDEWSGIERAINENEFPHLDSLNATTGQRLATASTSRGIRTIGLRVLDLEQSVRFWSDAFRFRMVTNGVNRASTRWARLAFRAIRPNWSVELVMAEGRSLVPSIPKLDDEGATCLALLSTDIRADLSRAHESHASAFELDVAGKRLTIALLRGPSGEIIELIQPPADTRPLQKAGSGTLRTAPSFA